MTTDHDPEDLDRRLAALLASASEPTPPADTAASALFENSVANRDHHEHVHLSLDVDIDQDETD